MGIDDLRIPPRINRLVREFYAKIHTHCEGYFMTWLRGHPIRKDAELISTIIHTPRVPEPKYPLAGEYRPPRSVLVECFTEGQPHSMATERTREFNLNQGRSQTFGWEGAKQGLSPRERPNKGSSPSPSILNTSPHPHPHPHPYPYPF
jgi:hypothetical protein